MVEFPAPPSPVRTLVACGWLGEGESQDRKLRVQTLSRFHEVCRVTAPDGRSAVVKQIALRGWESGRDLRRELYVYRMAGWLPSLAGVLPKPLLLDEQRQLLVVESVGGGLDWPELQQSPLITYPGLAARLGHAMAGWHRHTAGLALLPAPSDGILNLPDLVEAARADRPPATRQLMQWIVDDPDLVRLLRDGRAMYRHRCLIHGDIRRDNWLISDDSGDAPLTVVDWELSGSGDPLWDLASVSAESIVTLVGTGEGGSGGDPLLPLACRRVMKECLRAYTEGGGLLELHDAGEWDRLAVYLVARLLHVACEWADQQPDAGSGPAVHLLQEARMLARQREQLAASLASLAA